PADGHIFVSSKAPWFEIADGLPQADEYQWPVRGIQRALAAAKLRHAASSVAPVSSGYERSLRPCLTCFSLARIITVFPGRTTSHAIAGRGGGSRTAPGRPRLRRGMHRFVANRRLLLVPT